ncbi:hypothetical protein ACJRO7_022021 [Eucalyptus globulus]|uniref:phosphoribosylglycinamide formyltransferase 1 n=1 Tax=Eucalyptus globulus TaxID=34317 RepID=A0ABD3KNB3_EUCGL
MFRTRDRGVVLDPETRWAFEGPARAKRLERIDGVEMVASSSPDGEDVKCGVKRRQQQEKRLAVVVSGRVSNFQAIYKVNMVGLIRGSLSLRRVVKFCCAGVVFARDTDILVLLFPEPNKISMRCLQVTWLSCRCSIMCVFFIPIELIKSFPKSIINTHPFLLLAIGGKGYYGMKVHDLVIASGARPTIHFIDEHYDRGCILAQRVVPVLANYVAEELATGVLQVEHRLYVEALAALLVLSGLEINSTISRSISWFTEAYIGFAPCIMELRKMNSWTNSYFVFLVCPEQKSSTIIMEKGIHSSLVNNSSVHEVPKSVQSYINWHVWKIQKTDHEAEAEAKEASLQAILLDQNWIDYSI